MKKLGSRYFGGWNHRVCRSVLHYTRGKKKKRVIQYEIRNVYYDKRGKVNGWGDRPVPLSYEALDELVHDLIRMLEAATQKPVVWIGHEKVRR